MARAGRPAKSREERELAGNPGKRPLPPDPPKPDSKPPKCPDWLDPQARKKWRQLVPELSRLGLLTVVDGDALATYCQAWAEVAEATVLMRKEGRTTTNIVTGVVKAHPAVSMQRSAMMIVAKFAGLFGLSPADRGRVKSERKADDADLLAEFIGRKA